MTCCLCLTAFDRPELLEQALENLLFTFPSGADEIVVVSDGPKDPKINDLVAAYKSKSPISFSHIAWPANHGIAEATNASMSAFNGICIHVDSDCFIRKSGWAKVMAEFLVCHPEIGLLAPDILGRYMRIHRPDYDEIEYALGMVLAIRQDVLRKVKSFESTGFYDNAIHHQYEADLALRVRMCGYRVGIIDLGEFVDLGVGKGDSSRSTSVWRGGFEFLRKWNLYFTGQYRYKSPFMIRWDEYPLNYLWRRQWLAQFPYNNAPRHEPIQGHNFDIVEFPITPGKWLLQQTRDCLKQNVVFSGCDEFEKIDPELLAGKRQWGIGDLKNGG